MPSAVADLSRADQNMSVSLRKHEKERDKTYVLKCLTYICTETSTHVLKPHTASLNANGNKFHYGTNIGYIPGKSPALTYCVTGMTTPEIRFSVQTILKNFLPVSYTFHNALDCCKCSSHACTVLALDNKTYLRKSLPAKKNFIHSESIIQGEG